MGDNFLTKSWLFEVVDSETKKVDASFTLILPPNQYSIKEKQRVSITKTFGNVFVDDYGPDNLEITIQGISGTAHVFPTFTTTGRYRTDLSPQSVAEEASVASLSAGGMGFTHKSAFYTFRNEIMRYKSNFENFEQKELLVYDLADEQAYKCILLEFSVNRNADRPLWYPFTISLFVYARADSKKFTKPKKIDISKDPITALNKLDATLNKASKLFRGVQGVINQVALIQNQSQLLRARLNTFFTQTRRILESPLIIAKQLIDICMNGLGIVYDLYNQGKLTYLNYANAKEMMQSHIREALGVYGFAISEGSSQTKELVIEKDAGLDIGDVTTLTPVTKSITTESFSFSGLNLYTIKGKDTLQSIALSELGNSDLWPYIASVNKNIRDNSDLVPGDQIYIPVQSTPIESISKDSFILTENVARDPYGSDIKVDDDGNMIIQESNDLSLISGFTNVKQAIDLRMRTLVGSMLKQTAFGLAAQPGIAGTSLALSYLRMGVKSSLIQDPRISNVRNIKISFERDTIYLSADIDVVGSDRTLPVNVTF